MNLIARFQQQTLRVASWLAIAGALLFGLGLYVQNLAAFPSNVGVSEWWGSELAIRYCSGFVRRGLLGQVSWLTTGWLGHQASYVQALAVLMAGAVLLLGFVLAVGLIRRCGWRVGLLILMAPVGWPVMLNHAGALFRKDALQVLLGALLLLLWRSISREQLTSRRFAVFFLIAFVQIFAVFNHEPFALLILPCLAFAEFQKSASWFRSLLIISPGLISFLVAAIHRGNLRQVHCLAESLQGLGLLAPDAWPGSSITELALNKPSFFTWDLSTAALSWSAVHFVVMSLAALASYGLLMSTTCFAHPLRKAVGLWCLQLLAALPLFMATIDYGRWLAMIFCSGLLLVLIATPTHRYDICTSNLRILNTSQLTLVLVELLVLPTHCCTYGFDRIYAVIPYAGLSAWKSILHI
ncbi:hypothetical protein [Synechococcus sp. W4D4]|uniref:hypothetical protein n=1 Tax=Synechococcus sp. W4D4 TaxID=3392294 RepID=UPI0039ED162E